MGRCLPLSIPCGAGGNLLLASPSLRERETETRGGARVKGTQEPRYVLPPPEPAPGRLGQAVAAPDGPRRGLCDARRGLRVYRRLSAAVAGRAWEGEEGWSERGGAGGGPALGPEERGRYGAGASCRRRCCRRHCSPFFGAAAAAAAICTGTSVTEARQRGGGRGEGSRSP